MTTTTHLTPVTDIATARRRHIDPAAPAHQTSALHRAAGAITVPYEVDPRPSAPDLEAWSHSTSPESLRAVATHPDATAAQLRRIHQTSPTALRYALATHPHTPVDVLAALAAHADPALAELLELRTHHAGARHRLPLIPTRVPQPRPDLAGHPLPAGAVHMDHGGACRRCGDARCQDGCFAGEPTHVFVTGFGYLTWEQAEGVAAQWRAADVPFGPHHPVRRIAAECLDRDCSECAA